MSNKILVALQHEPNGAYDFQQIDTPEQRRLEDKALTKLAKDRGLKGLKLNPVTSEYKYSHDWHDAWGNIVPVFKEADTALTALPRRGGT